MAFVSRAEWGGRPPQSVGRIDGPVGYVFVHHTVTASGPDVPSIVRGVQRYHMDTNGFSDIAYSFLVSNEPGGVIYEGRNWGVSGAHTLNWNGSSYAVAFIGNSDVDEPTADAIEAIGWIIADGVRQGYVRPDFVLGGHRDAPGNSTGCPGDALEARLGDIRAWVERHLGGAAPAPAPAPVPGPAPIAGPPIADVRTRQHILNMVGCNAGAEDGIEGPQTRAATACWQRKLNIPADGVWGPQTQAANDSFWAWIATQPAAPAPGLDPGLAASLENAKRYQVQQGSVGDQVKWVQALVQRAGFDPGPVDGVFGPRTRQAVLAFQSSRGLQVDGVVGPQTWAALTS